MSDFIVFHWPKMWSYTWNLWSLILIGSLSKLPIVNDSKGWRKLWSRELHKRGDNINTRIAQKKNVVIVLSYSLLTNSRPSYICTSPQFGSYDNSEWCPLLKALYHFQMWRVGNHAHNIVALNLLFRAEVGSSKLLLFIRWRTCWGLNRSLRLSKGWSWRCWRNDYFW